ncbi:MAG: hypothetical protein ABEJ26_01890 [Halosimplex sp.]
MVGINTSDGPFYNPNFDFDERNCGDSQGIVDGIPGDPRDMLDENGGGPPDNGGNAPSGNTNALATMSQSPLFPVPFVGLMALSVAVLAMNYTREE